ncbi:MULTISPECIES: hypothetical protein [unclassified Corynebacterium]|uniref:hypothetical protein n=1 Tax=unclassified Corynebacterium TaxID=2624378 RepID=UPI001C45904C|nr:MULTISPECIES: hypothetical protein [unclassified Corynebacterium]MBV7281047.1 hypothetical protein [Corynebacterium sp. TAE3-ERU30]MBV7301617.1 hypothetical protein [Corynebacterium sp. TAE3-ERU2]
MADNNDRNSNNAWHDGEWPNNQPQHRMPNSSDSFSGDVQNSGQTDQSGYPSGYPTQGSYPGPGGYPNQGAYPNQGGYSDQGAHPGGHYGYPVEQVNKIAPWALGVSIAAVVLAVTVVGLVVAPFLAIAGIVLGIIAWVKGRKMQGPKRRVTMSIISVVISVLLLVIVAVITIFFGTLLSGVVEECQNVPEDQMETCIENYMNQ